MSAPENPHRLPRTVVPRRYDLTLEPDLAAATFAAAETVNVEVVEPTAEVVLNALDLEIDEVTADVAGEQAPASVASIWVAASTRSTPPSSVNVDR